MNVEENRKLFRRFNQPQISGRPVVAVVYAGVRARQRIIVSAGRGDLGEGVVALGPGMVGGPAKQKVVDIVELVAAVLAKEVAAGVLEC